MDKHMLKLIKIEKNALVYKSMPFIIFVLKWCDNKMLLLLKILEILQKKFEHWYIHKISNSIDTLYSKKVITKIKPKYPKKKKGK